MSAISSELVPVWSGWTRLARPRTALLGALNAVNAEALIVHRNVAHAEATGNFDTDELGELGDDAVPALEAALPQLSRQSQRGVVAHLCAAHQQGPGSWWAYNGARDGAIESRNHVCAGRTGS